MMTPGEINAVIWAAGRSKEPDADLYDDFVRVKNGERW